MAAWPSSLPRLLAPGYSESPQDQTLRTEMDAGPAKVRRRFSAAVTEQQIRLLLTDAQLATFESFWDTDLAGGALSIDWDDPRTGSAVHVRPVGRYTVTMQSVDYWWVSFVGEVLP